MSIHMTWQVDTRVPIQLGSLSALQEGDAVLLEGGSPAPPGIAAGRFVAAVPAHGPGCACCAPRSPAATALADLFQRRAKGEAPFFRRVLAVIATQEGEASLRQALVDDPLAAARFRWE
jgi:hypothetical protein